MKLTPTFWIINGTLAGTTSCLLCTAFESVFRVDSTPRTKVRNTLFTLTISSFRAADILIF
jgi:hypothetical protein